MEWIIGVQVGLRQGDPHQRVVRFQTGGVFEALPGLDEVIAIEREEAAAKFGFEGLLGR